MKLPQTAITAGRARRRAAALDSRPTNNGAGLAFALFPLREQCPRLRAQDGEVAKRIAATIPYYPFKGIPPLPSAASCSSRRSSRR